MRRRAPFWRGRRSKEPPVSATWDWRAAMTASAGLATVMLFAAMPTPSPSQTASRAEDDGDAVIVDFDAGDDVAEGGLALVEGEGAPAIEELGDGLHAGAGTVGLGLLLGEDGGAIAGLGEATAVLREHAGQLIADVGLERVGAAGVVAAEGLVGAGFALVVAVGVGDGLAALAFPGLFAADADELVVAVAALGDAGEEELRGDAGRVAGAAGVQAVLHEVKIVGGDKGGVRAADVDVEAGVGAEVGAVAEDVADADHAPVAAAAGLEGLLVEAAGDEADAHVLVQVETEDGADDNGLFGHELKAAAGADLVAVRRAGEDFALHGLTAHGGTEAVGEG